MCSIWTQAIPPKCLVESSWWHYLGLDSKHTEHILTDGSISWQVTSLFLLISVVHVFLWNVHLTRLFNLLVYDILFLVFTYFFIYVHLIVMSCFISDYNNVFGHNLVKCFLQFFKELVLLFLWHCFSITFHVINFLKCLLFPIASFQFGFAFL